MGFTLLQVNIRNWKQNKYLLSVSLPEHNPDILLLNELGATNEQTVKLFGYNAIEKSVEAFSGVAILIKKQLSFQDIPLKEPNIIAIKINTSLGPLIICTAYIPPRQPTLPRIAFN